MACSLYSIHRPIDRNGLVGFNYREEGYAAIDPQRKNREEAIAREYASEDFKRFDKMMRQLMHAPRAEFTANPEEEKTAKGKKAKKEKT